MALYLPSLGYPFLYDSSSQILLDTFIHQPRHLGDILTLRVLGMDVLDFNRPAILLSLMGDSLLWGVNPAGYRLTNLLLHGASAALLFRLINHLSGRFSPALFASLFFALHPLHSETVVEIGYREDLLATFFLLAGLCAACRFDPEARNWSKTWLPAFGVVGCFFLGVAAKESGVAGPASLAVFWWLFRRRRSAAASCSRRGWILLLAATGAACGAFLIARFTMEPAQSVIFTERPQPIAPNWAELTLIQTRIWAAELLRIVWPAGLCADYTGYSIRGVTLLPAIFGVAAFVGLQAMFGLRNRMIALGAAVFWFSLLPVSNFIPIYRPMADRFLYMPLIGAALMLAAAMTGLGALMNRRLGRLDLGQGALSTLAALTFLAVLSPLALATLREEAVWRDGLTLWEETTRRNPTSVAAWSNLGWAQLNKSTPLTDAEAAKISESFSRALNLTNGKHAPAFAGLAIMAASVGNHSEAARFLQSAVALDARFAQPDKFEAALIHTPLEILQFKLIALRSRNL